MGQAPDELERGRAAYGRRVWRMPTGRSRAPTTPPRWGRRTSSGWRPPPTCSAATRSTGASSSAPTRPPRGRRGAARGPLRVLARRSASCCGAKPRGPAGRPCRARARPGRRGTASSAAILLIPAVLHQPTAGDDEAAAPPRPRRPRSAGASATPTWWRSWCRSRATRLIRAGSTSRTACGCSTRRWWRSPPASFRRSSPGSCTATRSRSAIACIELAARASGPPR